MYKLPEFALLASLPWLKNVSEWSAPLEDTSDKPHSKRADSVDSFLLGGGGYLSARLGLCKRISTMERIMAPYLSSYNFAENVNFRKSAITPSRDFYPPFEFKPQEQHVWRVRNTAIIITAERDATYELVAVSAVHPELNIFLRHASLKNISKKDIEDIGISFSAPIDVPYPIAGHRSVILPLSAHQLSERLEELQPIDRDYSPNYGNDVQRYRYMVRGVIGAKNRGYEDLFVHTEKLTKGQTLEAVQYLAPSLDNSEQGAIWQAKQAEGALESRGIATLFGEIKRWWEDRAQERALFTSSNSTFTELIENNAVIQTCVERATGGFVVIDDYTGSWLRDHNGSHLLDLELGLHENVRRSMNRYYGLDVSGKSLYSVYASDLEPQPELPEEPDWLEVPGFITGDVPNFRTQWYWWYFKHTGDLEYVRARFNYMKGAFMRQKLHESGYLATYCFDETYGIGPVGPMRKGLSCDNSFNALSAARKLAYFAKLLKRDDAEELASYADNIYKAIEDTFWLEKEGYYAMRITPEGKLDKTPLSVGLLRPTWIGANNDPDDHAVRSALYAFKNLYKENGFIRLIPTHDQTVTMMIGYLLFAMKKIQHPAIDRVFYDVLKWADPSGTFGEYLDEWKEGPRQCYEHMAHRNRMWESGINTHAVLQTLTGFDPNAFENKVSFTPYLPAKWKHFEMQNLRVGNSYVSIKSERKKNSLLFTFSTDSETPMEMTVHLGHFEKQPLKVKLDKKEITTEWEKNTLSTFRSTITHPLKRTEALTIEVAL